MKAKLKTKTKKTETVVIKLTIEEAKLLGALIDFPDWGKQPTEVETFLIDFYENLPPEATASAKDTGFTDHTSIADDFWIN